MANFANIPKIRIFAVLAVLLMAIAPFIVPVENVSAASGDGGTYSYTITYNSSQMSSTSAAISVAGMDPVYHPSLSGTTASGYGDWTWDRNTGLGPFNSYYAAFDQTQGNKFVAILDPYNLKAGIDGTDYTSRMSSLNIMWVLPTVYWKSTSTTLTLSNDPSSGGTAYAHTIDGHVYNSLAIGVYEGSSATISGRSVLSSQSGVAPHHNVPLTTFRNLAHNVTMDSSLKGDSEYDSYSMLWNFYQWELFKLCSFAVMENFNSQAIVGNGPIYGNNLFTTGSTDARGPYAGNRGDMTDTANDTDSVKLFIENAWGGVREFVDGAMVTSSGFYLDSSSTPTGSTTPGGNVVYVNQAPGLSGNSTVIMTDPRVWGFAGRDGVSTDYNVGLADTIWNGENTSGKVAAVGGDSSVDPSNFNKCGISYVTINLNPSQSYARIGSRLAFVFDADPTQVTVSAVNGTPDYGTVSPMSAEGIRGSSVTVSGNTITFGGNTITATPNAADQQYTYAFEGWYIGTTPLTSSQRILADTQITARFTATTMEYTVSIISNNTDWGTVSPDVITDVPYGSTITTFNNTLRVNGTTVTATPSQATEYDRFTFQSWSVLSGTTVTGDMTITATFERRGTDVTVTIVPNNPDYGSVSVGTFDYVPVGSVIDIVGSTLTIAGNVTTATAAESTLASQFDFAGYFIGAAPITPGAAITSNTVITAVFIETPHLYNVPIRVNDPAYGTVDIGRLENVPYGAVMTVSGTSITVNDITVTATVADDNEQYRFSWAGWTYRGSTVVSGTTAVSGPSPIIATVDAVLQQYTVTWIIGETIETQTYAYGDWPTHDTPDAPEEGQVFYWWEPRVSHVTGDAEYTAIFGPPHEMPDYTPLVGIVITLLIMAIMFGIYKSGHDITGRDVALAMLALVILLLMIPYMAG